MATTMAEPLRSRMKTRGARPGKRRRYSALPFWLTFLVLGSLLVISFWTTTSRSNIRDHGSARLQSRDLSAFRTEEEECRLIHKAKDQCAFVYRHCPDAEPGFLAYLDLYYCNLAHVKPVAFIILLCWLGLLFSTIGIAASDFFCINLSTIATILGMSESMAGVTFLAFGNGSPDVFSTFAAMSTNSSSLAIGELIGAAGFITAVVAGSMALVRPFRVPRKSFIRDVGFFVVAAAFSMGFLADGKLNLWECIVMVVFYFAYVSFVVVWHWLLGRRKKRRQREAAARGHFAAPGNEELAVAEEYHDDEEEPSAARPSASRGLSEHSFNALERGSIPRIEEPEDAVGDDDEGARDRWMGELSSNMRLTRTNPRSRRNTMTPVRPSLVGALEFQAVLSSLHKSRNIQTIPMFSRRFSDDPNYTSAQQQDNLSSTSDPANQRSQDRYEDEDGQSPQRPGLDVRTASGHRARAVSANDAAGLQIDPSLINNYQPKAPSLIDIAEDDDDGNAASSKPSPDLLAPPKPSAFPGSFNKSLTVPSQSYHDSPAQSPRSRPKENHRRSASSLGKTSPQTSGRLSPSPVYRDDPSPSNSRPPSLYLPPPSVSHSISPGFVEDEDDTPEKHFWWWPYRVLPSPALLGSTLFPTLCMWKEKTWWERILSLTAVPSVFLLTITLPVVEADQEEDEEVKDLLPEASPVSNNEYGRAAAEMALESPPILAEGASETSTQKPGSKTSAVGGLGAAAVAANVERQHHHNLPANSGPSTPHPHNSSPPSPKIWNRWLTIIQLFLSPMLIVLVIYTQYLEAPDDVAFSRFLLEPLLISLLVSFVLLIPLLLTTTPTHRPKPYLVILSLAGFVVSIAWISTIASQVVALLKTFAVILNMSHAILGLTVFAVGNSLSDLIADITVAKLGYPVMALSACFGGPMLNILLGIGLSGCWILVRGAEHRHAKHPDKPIRYKTYEIEVGETLIVSGVILLITLVGLLIAVPLNKWMMTRRIAWSLIALWVFGTVINVVLEVVGLGEKTAGE